MNTYTNTMLILCTGLFCLFPFLSKTMDPPNPQSNKNGAPTIPASYKADGMLIIGASTNNFKLVKFALEKKAHINAKDNRGNTALHWAAMNGNEEMVAFLIHNGAIQAANNSGDTPLMLAAANGEATTTQLLIARGATINPMTLAMRVLIANGATIDPITMPPIETALHRAIENNHVAVAILLIEHGAAVNRRGTNGETPLHRAIRLGHIHHAIKLDNVPISKRSDHVHFAMNLSRINIAQLLMNHGADVNAMAEGTTPLLMAMAQGNPQLVLDLITHGARVNVMNQAVSPLDRALEYGHIDVAQILIENGANINSVDNLGRTSLHRAINYGNQALQAITFLITNGANVNARDPDKKETALHLAAIANNSSIVALLLSNGAHVNIRNFLSHTPLHQAVYLHVYHLRMARNTVQLCDIVQMLIEHGADVNLQGPLIKGSPLKLVFFRPEASLIKILITGGAIVNLVDESGFNTLHKCAPSVTPNQLHDALQILLENGADNRNLILSNLFPYHFHPFRYTLSHNIHAQRIIRSLRSRLKPPNTSDIFRIAISGSIEQMRDLLDAGISPNVTNENGNTALWLAALRQDHIVGAAQVQLLITRGAFPNPIGANGQSLLTVLYTYLPDRVALIRVITFFTNRLLFNALNSGRADDVTQALNTGANPNAEDEFGFTPVWRAAHYLDPRGAEARVRTLLDRGALANPLHPVWDQSLINKLQNQPERAGVVRLLTKAARTQGQLVMPSSPENQLSRNSLLASQH